MDKQAAKLLAKEIGQAFATLAASAYERLDDSGLWSVAIYRRGQESVHEHEHIVVGSVPEWQGYETAFKLIASPLEEWQREAIEKLLETQTKEVEQGTRVYSSSETYGDSRYHLISKKYDGDGVLIEQQNIDDKWGSRVLLQEDELPAILKTMLNWYLAGQAPPATSTEDSLGDLDDHPF